MVHIKQAGVDQYPPICQIGKGACGAVYLVRSAEDKKLYALKKIQLDESRKTRTREAVQREANIMAEMKHPHIVSYYDSFYLEEGEYKYLCIIQDYCDGGTLEDRILEATMKKQLIPEKQVIQLFLQIAMAVRYMHSKKVLHRDLKTQNVFLNKSGTICKLGDFGIAKNMEKIEVASTCVGTPCYLSPEMCQDIPYSSKADVWALGCMLYEMLVLRPAFDANNLVSLFYKIVKGSFDPVPELYSPDMKNLVAAILVKSADERPSAEGVLALPYVKAELLKFIEEKEMLQKRKLPTRQGSRPYSTSCLSRSLIAFFEEQVANGADIPHLPRKRATSCRPAVVEKVRERSLMSARNQHGRVSTIPEEPEDEQTRNLRILQQIQSNNNMEAIPEPEETPREQQQQPSSEKSGSMSSKKQSSSNKPPTVPLTVQIHQPGGSGGGAGANASFSLRNRSTTPTGQTATVKAVPESPRSQPPITAKSAKSSQSDNKVPKRGSTPTGGENKDSKGQKVAKKSSSNINKDSSSNKNRSHTPHKNKDSNNKKDAVASRENAKTPSKDKDPKVLQKSAKSHTSKKSSSSSSNIHSNDNLKGGNSHSQLTSSTHSIVSNSQALSNDIEMLSPKHEKHHHPGNLSSGSKELVDSLTSSLMREKCINSETPRTEGEAHGKNGSKLVRKNSLNKVALETADTNKEIVVEEITVPLMDSTRSHNAEVSTVPKLDLHSASKDSLPPINASQPIIKQEQIGGTTPRYSNSHSTPYYDPLVMQQYTDAPRQVGGITRNLKLQDGLPKLVIQSESSFTKAGSRRSSGRRASRGSMRRSSGKHGSKKRLSGKHRISDSISERPSTRDSLMSIPYEPSFDYYSDDFTDIDTDSDISEESLCEECSTYRSCSNAVSRIGWSSPVEGEDEDLEVPEDIPDLRRHGSGSAKYLYTQTFEIEEDLPGGELARDLDDGEDYEDDFEENPEDYSEILNVARELCEDLDKFHTKHHEVIMDHESRRPSANVVLKQQFIDAMGKEKYNKLKAYFDNNDHIEIKKVEKMVGKEHLKTAMLMKDSKKL